MSVPAATARTARLPSGESIPVLGQGTWTMAEVASRRASEIAALRFGLDLGMTLIDTAEMYADGGAEELVAEAIAGRRDEVFLVSKVMPQNASRRGTIAACERSLRRLGTDRIDLYLLHWPSATPVAETVDAFESLVRANKIRYWGVSNFDVDELEEVAALPGGSALATNQVPYSLASRDVERGVIPWCRGREIPIMAYTPIERGRIVRNRAVREVAARLGATPAQVALAWLLHHPGVVAIPKAGTPEHVRENRGAMAVTLRGEDLETLERG